MFNLSNFLLISEPNATSVFEETFGTPWVNGAESLLLLLTKNSKSLTFGKLLSSLAPVLIPDDTTLPEPAIVSNSAN